MWVRRVGLIFLVVGITTGAVSASHTDGMTLSGDGVLTTDGNRTVLVTWEPTTVELSAGTDLAPYTLCLSLNRSGRTRELTCHETASRSISVSQSTWPANSSGRATLVASVAAVNGTILSRTTHPVFLLAPESDRDGDGLSNRDEQAVGTNLFVADTDTDGLDDGREQHTYGTDPTVADTDGDGLADGVEISRYGTDPTVTDTDSDGLGDGVEVTTYGTDPTATDTDTDGLDDAAEVRTHETNPTTADTDGDGLDDGREVHVFGTNPRRQDTDGDGLQDGPEVHQYGTDPTNADTDGDGFGDGEEINRYGTDPTRANAVAGGRSDSQAESVGGAVFSLLPAWLPISELGVVAGLLVGMVLGCVVAIYWLGRRDSDVRQSPVESTPASEPDPPDTDSLVHPDAYQIHRLLDQHDGCLPQSEIVHRTDWSKSKVSRVLSAMAEENQIRKIPVGRENLVARPGEEPDGARGPFEE